MTLGVDQGVDRGRQGGDDKGEADNWSIGCLVKTLKPVMLLRRKLTRWYIKKVVNIFVVLKHLIYCLCIILEFLCQSPSFSSLNGSIF